ncbi:MAG: DUF61 family protein [Methanomicrobiales archaeon]|nr:DUF61 family protein [Methanomicrobiales archaeon]
MERTHLTDEGVLKRWFMLEMRRVNDGTVSERKTLLALLHEEIPSSVTKGGMEYRFDRRVLTEMARALPVDITKKLRIPMLFYCDTEVKNSCLLSERVAMDALKELGAISPLRTFHEGGVWISRAIVYSLIARFPTAIQIVMR